MNRKCARLWIAWLGAIGGSLLACLLAVAPRSGSAQQGNWFNAADKVQIPGVIRELTTRVGDADRLASNKRWREAVDSYLALIREHGDALVPIDPASEPLATPQRFVQARWLAHQKISNLPASALMAYRSRMDSIAGKWLEQAKAARDVRQLRHVVEDALLSRPAMEALELLGDTAFERGDFAQAQYWWRMLAVPASFDRDSRSLTYSDPTPEVLARVRAKQIVTLLFQEQLDSVAAELKAYRATHAGARGTLAGRQGKFADIIEELAKNRLGSLAPDEQEWPTFAGDPSRNRPLPHALQPRLWADGPTWRVRLDGTELPAGSELSKIAVAKSSPSQLAFHPIIVGGVVYVCDSRFIRGYRLRTGKMTFQFDLFEGRKVRGADDFHLKLPALPDLRCTLTSGDGYLCARMGGQWFGPSKEGEAEKSESESWLVCLKLGDSATTKPKLLWADSPVSKKGEQIIDEGAPILHQKAVYIARSRLKGVRNTTSICCFDAETGWLRWEQEVCDAPEFADNTLLRCRHHLLTLAGPNIVYCSHAGAVVAVDAATGKRMWAVRYPSRGLKTRLGQPTPRDLCPPLASDRRIVVAPADIDRVFCLDTYTGRSQWERESIDVVHLLGVSQRRLVFATATGLCAVHADTGLDDAGWRQPMIGTLASQGRGLLAAGWVFWPTQDAKLPWRAVDVLEGGLLRGVHGYEPGLMRALPAGNLAYGQRCLVVATGEAMFGYVMPPTLPGATGTQ